MINKLLSSKEFQNGQLKYKPETYNYTVSAKMAESTPQSEELNSQIQYILFIWIYMSRIRIVPFCSN